MNDEEVVVVGGGVTRMFEMVTPADTTCERY